MRKDKVFQRNKNKKTNMWGTSKRQSWKTRRWIWMNQNCWENEISQNAWSKTINKSHQWNIPNKWHWPQRHNCPWNYPWNWPYGGDKLDWWTWTISMWLHEFVWSYILSIDDAITNTLLDPNHAIMLIWCH